MLSFTPKIFYEVFFSLQYKANMLVFIVNEARKKVSYRILLMSAPGNSCRPLGYTQFDISCYLQRLTAFIVHWQSGIMQTDNN